MHVLYRPKILQLFVCTYLILSGTFNEDLMNDLVQEKYQSFTKSPFQNVDVNKSVASKNCVEYHYTKLRYYSYMNKFQIPNSASQRTFREMNSKIS